MLFKGLDEVGTDEVVRPPTRPSKNLDDDDDEERTLVTPDGVRVKIPPRIPEEVHGVHPRKWRTPDTR